MNQSFPQAFPALALDASRTLLDHAQKTQALFFAVAGEQLDAQAQAFDRLTGATPETLAQQGASLVREQAERGGQFLRQWGELNVATLQNLGATGRQAAEQAVKSTKGKARA